MALLALLLAVPTPLLGIQSPGDSAQLRRQAQRAQADFERLHRSNLPRARQDWSGSCDEQLGSICLRFDGGGRWEPAEEDPRVEAARGDLLEVLRAIGEALPGDRWVLGQRVRYLGDVGRWREAESVARGCSGGPPWWCSALVGYALHRGGNSQDALDAFSQALGGMRPEEARAWNDPQLLVEYPVFRWLRNPAGLTRDEALRRFWMLADPLYLTPGNERLAEHYSRRFASSLYGGTALTLGLSWGRPLEQLLLRYGFIAGWERTLPRMGEAPGGSVVEHYHPESRGLLPPLEALESPARLVEGAWRPVDERPRSSSAPVRAPLMVEGVGQTAVLRRGADFLLLAAYGSPQDTLLTQRRPRTGTLPWVDSHVGGGLPLPPGTPGPRGERPDTLAGLFLVAEKGDGPPLAARGVGGSGVLRLLAPPGRYLLSLELWSPPGRWGARVRHGIEVDPIPADVPSLSDLVLLHRGEGLPASLEEALPRMRAGTQLDAGAPLTVAWEVYGLGGRREPLTFRLSLVEEDVGLLRRVLSRTGLLQRPPVLTLSWDEGTSDPEEALFRAVDVDLPPLRPGSYVLSLEMAIPYRATALSRRRLTVPAPLSPPHPR